MTAAPDLTGPAAPPRRNGELAFEAPWESRLFGLTLSLHRAGRFAWEDFRALLIEEIRRAEELAGDSGAWSGSSYWECWRAALERLLARDALLTPEELAARGAALAARPPGHDHEHHDS